MASEGAALCVVEEEECEDEDEVEKKGLESACTLGVRRCRRSRIRGRRWSNTKVVDDTEAEVVVDDQGRALHTVFTTIYLLLMQESDQKRKVEAAWINEGSAAGRLGKVVLTIDL